MLDAGANPDATDQSLRSPLHYLCEGARGRVHAGGRGGVEGRAGEEAAAEAGVRLLLLQGACPGGFVGKLGFGMVGLLGLSLGGLTVV